MKGWNDLIRELDASSYVTDPYLVRRTYTRTKRGRVLSCYYSERNNQYYLSRVVRGENDSIAFHRVTHESRDRERYFSDLKMEDLL